MPTEPDALWHYIDPDPEQVWTFAYVSEPVVRFRPHMLRRLHLAAQAFNGRNGLTGRLVVVERGERVVRFVQVVEGPRDALQACAARIFADPRHGNISMIQSARIRARRFARWTMRYDAEPEAELGGDVAVALWRAGAQAENGAAA